MLQDFEYDFFCMRFPRNSQYVLVHKGNNLFQENIPPPFNLTFYSLNKYNLLCYQL